MATKKAKKGKVSTVKTKAKVAAKKPYTAKRTSKINKANLEKVPLAGNTATDYYQGNVPSAETVGSIRQDNFDYYAEMAEAYNEAIAENPAFANTQAGQRMRRGVEMGLSQTGKAQGQAPSANTNPNPSMGTGAKTVPQTKVTPKSNTVPASAVPSANAAGGPLNSSIETANEMAQDKGVKKKSSVNRASGAPVFNFTFSGGLGE